MKFSATINKEGVLMILDAPSRANFYPTPWKLPRHASTGKPSTAIAVAGGFGKGTIAALGLGGFHKWGTLQ